MPRRGIVLFIMPILLLAWFFVLPSSAKAADISVNTTWTKAQSPIIINENIWLKAGAVLTIEPGVTVKFNQDIYFSVSGILNAIGTKAEPIVFTSIKDDAYGGDSNNNGADTIPRPGDWSYLSVGQGGEANLDYVLVQYGGGYDSGAILSYKGKLTINHSVITKNNAAITLNQSTATINHSSVSNNMIPFIGGVMVDASISNNGRADIIVDATNNWWGSAQGPCPWRLLLPPGVPIWQVDIKAICGDKPLVDSGVVYSPWLTKWPELDPIILVPGIMGSWNVSGRWQIDPIFHTYDNLMEALIAAGYKEDSLLEDKPTLFTFPYDWRVDNNTTANLLKEKIRIVREITGSDQVDIIAHSMGGLVTRSYIEGSGYQGDIDQVIFLGTPHQGSLESYLKYEGSYFSGYSGAVQKYLFKTEAVLNGYLDLTDYIRAKILTVEQLLPIYDYLKDKQPDNSWQLRPYPLNYPQNNYLENLNSQENIDLLKQRVEITNIIGDLGNTSTLNSLKVVADPDLTDNKWQSGYPENLDKNLDSLGMGNGDGIVPLSSASSLNAAQTIITNSSDHANLPTIMQREIIKALTGQEPTGYFSSKITATIKRWAFFRVYSPVDFLVISPNDEKIGKDFTSDKEINQIPDAFYSGFGGQAEFVLIPNPRDGEYKIELQGVGGGGEYTFASSYIDEENIVNNQDLQIQSEILPDTIDNFTLNFYKDNPARSNLEPEVDFAKLIELTNKLYNAGEIKKENIKKLLIAQFGLLNKQYDKILSSKNNKQKQLLKIALKLELKLLNKTLDLYSSKKWITVKARDILFANINFLIDKLK